jgi:hypothetical protein
VYQFSVVIVSHHYIERLIYHGNIQRTNWVSYEMADVCGCVFVSSGS